MSIYLRIYLSIYILTYTYVFINENRYRDQTALQTHLLSSYFQDFGSRASPLMERPYEVKVGSGFLPGSVGVLRG